MLFGKRLTLGVGIFLYCNFVNYENFAELCKLKHLNYSDFQYLRISLMTL